ncbi:SDR family NAD(P)-dependent oxidoreductase [Nonomuraea sp. NPDC049152]|uniref:SDR family NAD(P)-dependent oxidoreductase n=1 Tax=Nonomuraea sp. NPDC049152 TaxID=3154350 RepID=UPI0034039098
MNGDDLQEWLTTQVAELGRRRTADPEQTFAANGLDSVRLAELAERTGRKLGRVIDPALLFEHSTIATLAAHLRPLAEAGAGAPAMRPVAGPAAQDVAGIRPLSAAVAPAGPARGPIAVVGLACRMPGAADAEEYWKLLLTGTEAVREVPQDRWPDGVADPDPATPGRLISTRGGFLDGLADFDAAFFRISEAEALRMDPQQRLLLETSWDAMEDAGSPPSRLRGSRTGVFVGMATGDYAHRQLSDPDRISAHTTTGNSFAIAANRLSYYYDWRGPSVAVDTACSSSLVATHLAIRALRAGDCELALACGVNALIEPEPSIGLSKAGMLAPDGRCKPFDAEANGYVRGEGCGVVVLKRLEDALAAGDRIYAVLRGGAVNQDGASNGLTAPNPAAQRAVLHEAYADAGLAPGEVQYVECHGTGTPLGDPIEAGSLAAARGREAGECLIGSVKGNIGHLEAAAGVAGLIKTVLAVHHGLIPPSLHYSTPNPRIPFDEHRLRVATHPVSWPDGPRLAGVSSFGFGGTNAHVVVGQAPAPAPAPPSAGPLLLPLTARGRDELSDLLSRTARRVESADEPEILAVAATMATRRTHHRPYRTAVVAGGPAELRRALSTDLPEVSPAPAAPPRIAFVFSGQGSQWPGMGRTLLADEPLFRSVIRRCDEAVRELLDWSIETALDGGEPVDLEHTAVAQPLIVAVQIAMAELLGSYGIVPDAVVGHSVGEISAAVAAGELDLEAGMRLAVSRGRLMAEAAPGGGMLAVGLPVAEARRWCGDGVEVAAVNAPAATVLAGSAAKLEQVARDLTQEGIFARRLPVAYAFHSSSMARAAELLGADQAGRAAAAPEVPLYSTITGRRVAGPNGERWGRGVREPVLFADAVTAALDDGLDLLLEVGPRPVLQASLRDLAGTRARVLSCVDESDQQQLAVLRTLARLFGLGAAIRWQRLYPSGSPVVSAPVTPWCRRRFWLERPSGDRRAGADPLLGGLLDLATSPGHTIWQGDLDPVALPYLSHHKVGEQVIFPAAGYADLLRRAGGRHEAVAGLRLHRPLVLDRGRRLQTTLDRARRTVTVHARDDDGQWREQAAGRLVAAAPAPAPQDLALLRARCPREVTGAELYELLRRHGLDYGAAFRGVEQVWTGTDEALGVLAGGGDRIRLLDAAFHVVAALVDPGHGPALPVAVEELTWWAEPGAATHVHVTLEESGGAELTANLNLTDENGTPVARVTGLTLRRAVLDTQAARLPGLRLYQVTWRPRPIPACPTGLFPSGWVVIAPPGERLAEQLAERAGFRICRANGELRLDAEELSIDPRRPGHYRQLVRHLAATGPLRGVIHLPGADADTGVLSAALLLRALSYGIAEQSPRVLFATTGAQPVGEHPVSDPFAAAVWGLAKVIPLEHPSLEFLCLDLDPDDQDPVSTIREELAARWAEAEVGYRSGLRYVRRIAPDDRPVGPPITIRADGVYAITGGTGALGLQVAAHLVELGARRLALIGRTKREGAEVPAWRAHGVDVRVLAADVSDREQLDDALRQARAGGQLRGVVHAAGLLHNGPLLDLEARGVRDVFGPKVSGAWHLHELTSGDELDWFACFSSAAGVLGSPGQAGYAAANAFLDALAHHRRAEGLPAVSFDWGPWAAGMAATWETDSDRELRTAAKAILPDAGVAAFASLAAGDRVQPVVLPFDLRNLAQFYPSDTGRSFLSEIATAEVDRLRSIGTQSSHRPDLATEYLAPRNDLERQIAAIWQKAMSIQPIGVRDGFFELGGDSVMANQILIDVNRALGVTVSPERAFDDFSIANLAVLAEQEMRRLLESLTDEEAERLLAQGKAVHRTST